jgi:hypothetical protein
MVVPTITQDSNSDVGIRSTGGFARTTNSNTAALYCNAAIGHECTSQGFSAYNVRPCII